VYDSAKMRVKKKGHWVSCQNKIFIPLTTIPGSAPAVGAHSINILTVTLTVPFELIYDCLI
jgi:uncharacterized protein